ncbi:MAG: AAA family ATPase, partial [Fusobacteriaceae bacterium]|nr:AAA family ATPase [Fusobacteriaceae bacterium]
MRALPIGISDFKEMIESDYFYADKTNLINKLLINKVKVTLFTRPRRFGKTLNMSMLRYFFDIRAAEENKRLFKGLNIEKTDAWVEQGKYPIIFVSFKDIKVNSVDKNINEIYKIVFNILIEKNYIYEKLSRGNKKIFDDLLNNRDSIFLNNAFKYLSQFLYEYYNKKVIIIIDEYDTPIISAYANKYYDEAIEFFKNFYSSALKDNEYLQFAVMTGIMRVAKEGIFSGLNNLMVDTILDKNYEDYFGLSENDVDIA